MKGTLSAAKAALLHGGNCSIHSPIEGGFRGVCLSIFLLNSFFTYSCVFRIDPHATLVAPVEDENTDSGIVPPLVKGVRRIWNSSCSVIARSAATWQSLWAILSFWGGRRFFTGHDKNLIYSNSTIQQIRKVDSWDCHDLKKRGLAMTTKSSFSLDGRRSGWGWKPRMKSWLVTLKEISIKNILVFTG